MEKGLHTKSAESIAEDVLAYGGSARVGHGPGRQRVHGRSELPLLHRRRRSRSASWSAATPTTIPPSSRSPTSPPPATRRPSPTMCPTTKKWHTANWKIDDAQFVSLWAYNFTLNSGQILHPERDGDEARQVNWRAGGVSPIGTRDAGTGSLSPPAPPAGRGERRLAALSIGGSAADRPVKAPTEARPEPRRARATATHSNATPRRAAGPSPGLDPHQLAPRVVVREDSAVVAAGEGLALGAVLAEADGVAEAAAVVEREPAAAVGDSKKLLGSVRSRGSPSLTQRRKS